MDLGIYLVLRRAFDLMSPRVTGEVAFLRADRVANVLDRRVLAAVIMDLIELCLDCLVIIMDRIPACIMLRILTGLIIPEREGLGALILGDANVLRLNERANY